MGYYFQMSFAETKSTDQFLEQISEMKNEMWNQRFEIIKDLLNNNISAKEQVQQYNTETMMTWLRRVLTLRLLYWKQFNLLGYCGDGTFENFHEVTFQNSCDRDYGYDTYPSSIPFFKNKIEEITKLSDNELLKTMNVGPGEAKRKQDKLYLRRICLYDTIYNSLGFKHFLYSPEDNTIFQRFDICAREHDYDFAELARWTKNQISR